MKDASETEFPKVGVPCRVLQMGTSVFLSEDTPASGSVWSEARGALLRCMHTQVHTPTGTLPHPTNVSGTQSLTATSFRSPDVRQS